MYGQMKLHVATCTPGTSNTFCQSLCTQCRKLISGPYFIPSYVNRDIYHDIQLLQDVDL